MTNETASYNTLRRNAMLPRDRCDRVENLCVPGMPDANMCLDGVEVWAEIKTVRNEPARATTPLLSGSHKLSQEQANWLHMHARAGGRGFVYVDAPNRRYLIRGEDAGLVNGSSATQLMLLAEWISPVPTPTARWRELREKLRGSR